MTSASAHATTATSRSAFRLLARSIGATNREADGLRRTLLTQWAERGGDDELLHRLEMLDDTLDDDPEPPQAVERLTVWFSFADRGDNEQVANDDPVLAGLSDELRDKICSTLSAPADSAD